MLKFKLYDALFEIALKRDALLGWVEKDVVIRERFEDSTAGIKLYSCLLLLRQHVNIFG